MIIGIPRESHSKAIEEYRVGLSPGGVADLVALGAQVVVERGAGEGAGFSDEEYRRAGAQIVYTPEEAYRRADVVVKVQRPRPEELDYLREGTTLMGFLHLAVAPREVMEKLRARRITAIGYEVIQRQDGTLPVLKPMSMIAGRMSAQIAGRLLEKPRHHGRGVLLGGIPGLTPADVVIVGAGALGFQAARTFVGVGAHVIVMDKNPDRLEHACESLAGRVITMVYKKPALERLVKFADVLVLAVLSPGKRAPILVTEEMVRSMKPGSVILDFSVDQGGAAETTRVTPTEDQVYRVHDVLHFAVPNVPSWVARTSTHALTNALLPYLRKIVEERNVDRALQHHRDLMAGVYLYQGKIAKATLLSEGQALEVDLQEHLGEA